MSATTPTLADGLRHPAGTATEPPAVRRVGDGPLARPLLIGAAVLLTLLFLGAPVLVILARAFSAGPGAYLANVLHPDTLHAIGLTVLTVAIVLARQRAVRPRRGLGDHQVPLPRQEPSHHAP